MCIIRIASIKNLTLSPKKSFKTEVSGIAETKETKSDVIEKGASPKYGEKPKTTKESEVVKQVDAQVQQQKRIKKPAHMTKSLAMTINPKDFSLVNDSKVSDNASHRMSVSIKDVPWEKMVRIRVRIAKVIV